MMDYLMYSAKLLQYFREPRCVGLLPAPAVTVGVENPICGDILKLSVEVVEGRVVKAGFQAKGCAASIAAGAAVAEWAEGRGVAELGALTVGMVEELLEGLPNESKHAAVLAVDAARGVAAKEKGTP
jgi:nitrogen fixation NifU-like protein